MRIEYPNNNGLSYLRKERERDSRIRIYIDPEMYLMK